MNQKPPEEILKNDPRTFNLLNSITLKDGTKLLKKTITTTIQDIIEFEEKRDNFEERRDKKQKIGLLEGAMGDINPELKAQINNNMMIKTNNTEKTPVQNKPEQIPKNPPNQTPNITKQEPQNINLQEIPLIPDNKEELNQGKNNMENIPSIETIKSDITQQQNLKQNEPKVNVSEEVLNTIAKVMAKKIAKYVYSICTQEVKASTKSDELEEKNKALCAKIKNLEEENKKLHLLLAESNKNLDSYKPIGFNLYKKTEPKK